MANVSEKLGKGRPVKEVKLPRGTFTFPQLQALNPDVFSNTTLQKALASSIAKGKVWVEGVVATGLCGRPQRLYKSV